MAIFGYVRVSTREQTIDNQKLEIGKSGYQVDYWHEDTTSGKTCACMRPGFSKLLEHIRDGETLVVSKLDRLGRDAIDVSTTLRNLAARNIKVIVLQVGDVDLSSPAGKLMVAMLAAMAEMERDILVERTQAGLARARAQGKHLGRPCKTTPQQRSDMCIKYDSGASISSIAREYKISRTNVISIVK